jgi:hypothetical protein
LESLTGTLPDAAVPDFESALSAVLLTLTELLPAAAVSSFPPPNRFSTLFREIEEAQIDQSNYQKMDNASCSFYINGPGSSCLILDLNYLNLQ